MDARDFVPERNESGESMLLSDNYELGGFNQCG